MLVDDCRVFAKSFVLTRPNVFALIFRPDLNFVERAQDSSKFVDAEICLSETVAALSNRLLESSFQAEK